MEADLPAFTPQTANQNVVLFESYIPTLSPESARGGEVIFEMPESDLSPCDVQSLKSNGLLRHEDINNRPRNELTGTFLPQSRLNSFHWHLKYQSGLFYRWRPSFRFLRNITIHFIFIE